MHFFFDFMSPFAYLAHDRVCELAKTYKLDLSYWPMDLAAAKIAAGNSGPANRDIPVKLRYLLTDINRWAEKSGMPVKFPASLDSHRVNAGTFYAMIHGDVEQYVRTAFTLGWGRGGDLNSDELLAELASTMGWSAHDFIEHCNAGKELANYQNSTNHAIDKGVFGVPTVMLKDQMWWGNDRLDFVEEYLAKNSA
jgi:2-hydroxychromene-2-carboxylate isomerase